jgi:hypothetical protein
MHGITVEYQSNRAIAHVFSQIPKGSLKYFKGVPAALRVINPVAIHLTKLGDVNAIRFPM